MTNTPSEYLRRLLQEARSALWQPANAELCERIDDALARWGTPQPVVLEPLTPSQYNIALSCATDIPPSRYEAVTRAIERAHGITQKGGQHGADTRSD